MSNAIVCQNIRVSGVVQGVGFRPFVWRLARELGLAGWVRNDSRGVEIEVRGAAAKVRSLTERLEQEAPPLARINSVVSRETAPAYPGDDFVIIDSRSGRAATMIGHDTAVCRDCLTEMFDPGNRRWRYALAAPIHPTGTTTAAAATAYGAPNGWRRTARYWLSPITRSAASTSPSSAAFVHRASRPTGNSCCGRWSCTIPTRTARSATGRSSITACHCSPTWR